MKDVASDGRELDRWSRLAVARKTFVSRGPDVEGKEEQRRKRGSTRRAVCNQSGESFIEVGDGRRIRETITAAAAAGSGDVLQ